MIATVKEAQDMWCPFARVRSATGIVYNRGSDGDTDGKPFCLSYACMAFRWVDDADAMDGRRGYCGLAGVVS